MTLQAFLSIGKRYQLGETHVGCYSDGPLGGATLCRTLVSELKISRNLSASTWEILVTAKDVSLTSHLSERKMLCSAAHTATCLELYIAQTRDFRCGRDHYTGGTEMSPTKSVEIGSGVFVTHVSVWQPREFLCTRQNKSFPGGFAL